MSMLPEDCCQIGFPTDEGTGCYWQTDYYLVVNKEAGHPELIHDYLTYLLEEDCQNRTMQPVRQDMVGKNIVANDMDDTVQYSDNAGGYYVLETGADGTIWLEEYEKMQSLYLKEQDAGTQERLKKGRRTDIERDLTT